MKRRAVSEVIGTMILVGVVMVGIVLVGILLLSNPLPTKVPVFDAIISNRSNTIYIYHKGGDALQAGEFFILVDGQPANFTIMSPGTFPWSVGETLTNVSPTMPRHVVIILNQSGGGGSVISESDLSPVLTVPLRPLFPPSVIWSNLPAFGNATTPFQFTDSSTGKNISSYFWDFNDANTSTTRSPAHPFPCNTGDSYPYSINHSATDSGGTSWEATTWLNRSAWVTVYKNLTPTITFTQDKISGMIHLVVNFAATGYGAINVDTWSWNFGDSSPVGTEQSPSHTYTVPGTYDVSLTATNYTLGVTSVTRTSFITALINLPTVVWSRSPAFGNATTPFTFTDSSTSDNITDYFWNFNYPPTSIAKNPPPLTFPLPTGDYDQYNINHSVTDSGGTGWAATSWLNRSANVTVYKNTTLDIIFTPSQRSGAIPLAVTFTGTAALPIKADVWLWTFGDAVTSSSNPAPHTYSSIGHYDVSLTATNYTLGVTSVAKANLITAPGWYNCSWLYRKNITLNKTAVAADLTYFPVLISYTDTDLSARAQGDGDDILFTRSDGTTQIPHEIESYSGGALTAWVNVTSLTSGTNTTIYMYYGNSTVLSQQNPTKVWDSNHKAVWHFKEDPSGGAPQMYDSKNTNHGTSGGSMTSGDQVAGNVDGSLDFDKVDDYIQMTDNANIQNIFASGGTFSAWINPRSIGENSEGDIGWKASDTNARYGWSFATYTNNVLMFRKGFSTTAGRGGYWRTPTNSIAMNSWQYVVVTYNSGSTSNDPSIYINGSSRAITEVQAPASGYSAASDVGNNMRIGNAASNDRTFDGIIDEIRVSNSVRDANWIQTEYNNQANPALFHYNMTQESFTC